MIGTSIFSMSVRSSYGWLLLATASFLVGLSPCVAWGGVDPGSRLTAPASTVALPSLRVTGASVAPVRLSVGRLRADAGAFGVMRQSFLAPGVSLLLTIPAGAVGLVPLIGNAVVLGRGWKKRTKIGWGFAGIAVGVAGIAFTGVMWGLDRPSSDTGGFEPARDVVNPIMIAVHAATVALGVINIVQASTRDRRAQAPPVPTRSQRGVASFRMSMQ